MDLAGRYLAQAQEGLAARTEFFAFQHAQVGLAAVELRLRSRDYEGAVAEARARGDEQRALMRPYVRLQYLEGEAGLRGELEAATQAIEAQTTASALGTRDPMAFSRRLRPWRTRGGYVSSTRTREEARSIVGIEDSLGPVGFERFQARRGPNLGTEGQPI
jgi:hypothetical protein